MAGRPVAAERHRPGARLDAAEEAEPGGVLVSVASRIDLHYLVAGKKMSAELAGFSWEAVTSPERDV